MIADLLVKRDRAFALGDFNLVREINDQLVREGYVETAVAPMEMAVPVKRGPGRPRKNPV